MRFNRGNFQFLEFCSRSHDGLTHRLERFGLCVLRGELPELLESVHLLEWSVAHKEQLLPCAIEFTCSRVVEHEPAKVVILAVKKSERHHFIDRDDSRVAKRDGKKAAKLIKRSLETGSRFAAVVHDDRRAVLGDEVIVAPLAALQRGLRFSGNEARRAFRLLREHLHLDASRGFGCQPPSHHELRANCKSGGNMDFEHRGRFGSQVLRGGLLRPLVEEPPKQRRCEREILLQKLTHFLREFRRWILPPLCDWRRQIRCGSKAGRLADEVPRSIRIARENIRGDILREVPVPRTIVEREIHRGEVANMASIARPDDKGNDVTSLHADVLKRAEFENIPALCVALRQHFGGIATADFERPSDAVAAVGVRVGDVTGDSKRAGFLASPRDH